ncbi:hypothetical protein J6590_020257 [Homalodisca vitripennis]|nr:hypothetical protein J6590_020257 [Homalodisca vitripennis]
MRKSRGTQGTLRMTARSMSAAGNYTALSIATPSVRGDLHTRGKERVVLRVLPESARLRHLLASRRLL